MSKAKLIELIKMPDLYLHEYLLRTPGKEIKALLRQALKEQDRDTRHGCAEEVVSCQKWSSLKCENGTEMLHTVLKSKAHAACMNYQDKDLEGL